MISNAELHLNCVFENRFFFFLPGFEIANTNRPSDVFCLFCSETCIHGFMISTLWLFWL